MKNNLSRKSFFSFILINVFLVQLLTAMPRPNSSSVESQTAAKLEKHLDPVFAEILKSENIAGSAIAIVKDGKIVFAKGYGLANVEKKTPVVADKTIFRIGSISKAFTATGMVQLAERKKISLDDDVNKHLKDLKVENTFPEPIRIKHLLTHTSGLDEINLGRKTNRADRVIPMDKYLADRLRRRQAPGKQTSYSTYGITLAGRLIETISGMSYTNYFDKHFFSALGMKNSNVGGPPAGKEASFATGYSYSNGTYYPEPYEYFHTLPASDINGTVTDMGRFMIALLGDGSNKDGRILSPAAAEEMHKQQFTNNPKLPGMTYGFFENRANGIPAIEHGGSMNGFTALMYMSKKHNLGIFVAQNSEKGYLLGRYKSKVLDFFYADKKQKEEETPSELRRFTGSFRADFYCHTCKQEERGWLPRAIDIRSHNNGTLAFWGSEWDQIEPLVFKRRSGTLDNGEKIVVFREDSNKNIIGLFEGINTYIRVRERRSLAREMLNLINSKGIAEARKFFNKENGYQSFYTNEGEMNRVGYSLLTNGRVKDAIEVFKLITLEFPVSANAFDSLGEGFLRDGQKDKALKNYKRSLLLDPTNTNAQKIVKEIEAEK